MVPAVWQHLIPTLAEIPDPLRHRISVSHQQGQLYPPIGQVYSRFLTYAPEDVLVIKVWPTPEFHPFEPHTLHICPRLTAESGSSLAHAGLGWEDWFVGFVKQFSTQYKPIIWVFMDESVEGYKSYIQKKYLLISPNESAIIEPEDLELIRGRDKT